MVDFPALSVMSLDKQQKVRAVLPYFNYCSWKNLCMHLVFHFSKLAVFLYLQLPKEHFSQ